MRRGKIQSTQWQQRERGLLALRPWKSGCRRGGGRLLKLQRRDVLARARRLGCLHKLPRGEVCGLWGRC